MRSQVFNNQMVDVKFTTRTFIYHGVAFVWHHNVNPYRIKQSFKRFAKERNNYRTKCAYWN